MSYPLFLTVTTVTVTSSLFSLFPYQALQRPEQFVGHVGGILGNVESRARVYRPEVRVVGAIVAAGDRDVLALVDVRVALHSLLVSGLNEGHHLVVVELLASHVATEHAVVVLACLHAAIAAQVHKRDGSFCVPFLQIVDNQ